MSSLHHRHYLLLQQYNGIHHEYPRELEDHPRLQVKTKITPAIARIGSALIPHSSLQSCLKVRDPPQPIRTLQVSQLLTTIGAKSKKNKKNKNPAKAVENDATTTEQSGDSAGERPQDAAESLGSNVRGHDTENLTPRSAKLNDRTNKPIRQMEKSQRTAKRKQPIKAKTQMPIRRRNPLMMKRITWTGMKPTTRIMEPNHVLLITRCPKIVSKPLYETAILSVPK